LPRKRLPLVLITIVGSTPLQRQNLGLRNNTYVLEKPPLIRESAFLKGGKFQHPGPYTSVYPPKIVCPFKRATPGFNRKALSKLGETKGEFLIDSPQGAPKK